MLSKPLYITQFINTNDFLLHVVLRGAGLSTFEIFNGVWGSKGPFAALIIDSSQKKKILNVSSETNVVLFTNNQR